MTLTPDDDPVLYFDRDDGVQVLVDVAVGGLLYAQLASADSSPAWKAAALGGSLLVANFAYNSVLGRALHDVTHPAQAVLQAVQNDLGGDPQKSLVGNALLAGGVYYGAKGAKKGWEAWRDRPQGEVAEAGEAEAAEVAEAEAAEAAPMEVEAEEGVGDVILDGLADVGEGFLDALPELAFL